MLIVSFALAVLVVLAIWWIGVGYLTRPWAMAPSFGLPLPESMANTTWWLRLKGVRDIASGVAVASLLLRGDHRALGLVLLALALIPLGDMSVILAARGRTAVALGVHGTTAALMVVAALPLLLAG